MTSKSDVPTPVKLGDTAGMRRAMEDGIAKWMEKKGHRQDHKKTDIFIGLGIVCVSVTLLAQFYPGKWPKNFWLSVGCLAVFVLCSAAMEYVNRDDSIPFFLAGEAGATKTVHVTCKFPRFTSTVTLAVGPKSDPYKSKEDVDVGQLFDTKGYLLEQALGERVDRLLRGAAGSQGDKKKK